MGVVVTYTNMIVFVIFGCFFGLSSARSMPTPTPALEVDDVIDDRETYDVLCDVKGCNYDLELYCLDNGVIVMGSCSLKNTLCTNGVRNSLQMSENWDVCFRASYVVQNNMHRHQQMMMAGVNEKQNSLDNQPAVPPSVLLPSSDKEEQLLGFNKHYKEQDAKEEQDVKEDVEGEKESMLGSPFIAPAVHFSAMKEAEEKETEAASAKEILEVEKQLEKALMEGKMAKGL